MMVRIAADGNCEVRKEDGEGWKGGRLEEGKDGWRESGRTSEREENGREEGWKGWLIV